MVVSKVERLTILSMVEGQPIDLNSYVWFIWNEGFLRLPRMAACPGQGYSTGI
jgi:hypothetical protein